MTATAKFMFDLDFGSAPKAVQPTISATQHEAEVAEAEMRGYRERRLAGAFEHIASGLDQLRGSLKAVEDRFEAEAVEVALAVGKKLAATLISLEPFAEAAALADNCFRELLAAPHIVVRVNGALYTAAKTKLEEIAQARGFEGRLVVMAEPDIEAGDCRIEWADGGLKRDRAATERAISEAVERYVASRRGGPVMP